ncbi:MAG TPA: RraA family protein [bacterium]
MTVTLHKFPEILETYYLDEARSMPASYWTVGDKAAESIGTGFSRFTGNRIMAGWALPITCDLGNDFPILVALQYIFKNISSGRWVIVVTETGKKERGDYALWNHLKSATGWEAGVVGCVVDGFAQDIEETTDKLGGEFCIYSRGTSPAHPDRSPSGLIGAPVEINGVTIHTGDLIIGDLDGIVRIKKSHVIESFKSSREKIIDTVNRLAQIREGRSAMDILNLHGVLNGNLKEVE